MPKTPTKEESLLLLLGNIVVNLAIFTIDPNRKINY